MTKKILRLIGWIFIFQLIGYILGHITQVNMAWYQTLHKSNLTPPGFVFSIVWIILYVMIALAGWWLWQQRRKPNAKVVLLFYWAQMLMNWAWTPLFFYFHFISLSFYWIISITILTLITLIISKDKFKFSSMMLIPYFLWLLFAGYLNGVILMLN